MACTVEEGTRATTGVVVYGVSVPVRMPVYRSRSKSVHSNEELEAHPPVPGVPGVYGVSVPVGMPTYRSRSDSAHSKEEPEAHPSAHWVYGVSVPVGMSVLVPVGMPMMYRMLEVSQPSGCSALSLTLVRID